MMLIVDIIRVPIEKQEIDTAIDDIIRIMEELKTNPVTSWPQAKRLERAIRLLTTEQS